jgi:DEAD/DEAH box helicase domain-containing protein
MKYLALDIETQRLSGEVEGGWDNIPAFGLAVAVVMNDSGRWRSYLEVQADELLTTLEIAPLIVTFNGIRFDYEVLRPYGLDPEALYPKSYDILAEMEKVLGHRVSLNNIARAMNEAVDEFHTLKSADGMLAVEWFRKGEVKKVIDYCLNDVRVTRAIFEFIQSAGYVYYTGRSGVKKCILVDEMQEPLSFLEEKDD